MYSCVDKAVNEDTTGTMLSKWEEASADFDACIGIENADWGQCEMSLFDVAANWCPNDVDAMKKACSGVEECAKADGDLFECVEKAVNDDTTGTMLPEFEEMFFGVLVCYEEDAEDVAAQIACDKAFLDFATNLCPDDVDAMEKACGTTSFKFEDFALDLADERSFTLLELPR
jgi:hypothetical protein